jgi:predicted HTH transcriptional regulator
MVATKSSGKVKKLSSLAVAKLGNAKKLLEFMKKGKEYTQVMLEEISKIPYRSVRRYIEALLKQGKIIASGYGKGKHFRRV